MTSSHGVLYQWETKHTELQMQIHKCHCGCFAPPADRTSPHEPRPRSRSHLDHRRPSGTALATGRALLSPGALVAARYRSTRTSWDIVPEGIRECKVRGAFAYLPPSVQYAVPKLHTRTASLISCAILSKVVGVRSRKRGAVNSRNTRAPLPRPRFKDVKVRRESSASFVSSTYPLSAEEQLRRCPRSGRQGRSSVHLVHPSISRKEMDGSERWWTVVGQGRGRVPEGRSRRGLQPEELISMSRQSTS